jgi:hypothetical protein
VVEKMFGKIVVDNYNSNNINNNCMAKAYGGGV